MRDGSRVDTIRQFASVQSVVRKKQIREALGFSKDQVASAVDTLLTQGYLKRVAHGVYQFQSVRERHRESPIEDMIWSAMKVNVRFTAAQVAMHSGSTTSYVYKRFRVYREDGYLRAAGRQKNLNGDYEQVWRLTPKGKEKANVPRKETFTPDALVEKVITLNNLICSGRARREEDARAMSMKLCRSIERTLQEDMESHLSCPDKENQE